MTQPAGERCETCRFEVSGTCHFNPPNVVAAFHDVMWPFVKPDDWCGHYKAGAGVGVDEPGPFEEFDK